MKHDFDKEIQGMRSVNVADLIIWCLYTNERGRCFFELSRLETMERDMSDPTSEPTDIPYRKIEQKMKELFHNGEEENVFCLSGDANYRETLMENFSDKIELPARFVFWRSIEKGIPSQGVLPEELHPGR